MKRKGKRWVKKALSLILAIALLAPIAWKDVERVDAAAGKKVKKVAITKPATSTLTLQKGSTYTLKTKVTPKKAKNKKLAYASNKKKVATVSTKGKIKARKAGKAKITVTSRDGSKKKAAITVTVANKLTKVRKLTLSKKSATLYIDGTASERAITLKPTFKPKKATTKKASFTSSKKGVATVNAKGVVTAKKEGSTTITAYAADGWGAKATFKVTVAKKSAVPSTAPTPPVSANPTARPHDKSEEFDIVTAGAATDVYIDAKGADYKGLKMVADSFAGDVKMVSNVAPNVKSLPDNAATISGDIIVVGSIGNNVLIDKWISEGKLNVDAIKSQYETYSIVELIWPEDNVGRALVIVGSDKRGTIYGIYHISEMMGVSPWYYWGDVEPAQKDSITFARSELECTSKQPSVRYRGIFLNDEAPSLTSWVDNFFTEAGEDTYNEKFYKHVFELILRLKGNYLWPAMWNNRFGTDGAEFPEASAVMADDYGVVMGTSHHEPMVRADKEWNDNASKYGNGQWDYRTNKQGLNQFWEDGIKLRKDYENVVTMGMRGQADSALEGTVSENIELLKDLVVNQKAILSRNGMQDAPKVLTLYSEVERYWHGTTESDGTPVAGLRDWAELDDVTIMLTDDNFGNLRTLPTDANRNRAAGWGMYYHFDMHGPPNSMEWVQTFQLEKTWEQMSMAYDYGIDDIWIVNVGDLKPMEMPISFFLDMAYDFDAWGTKNLDSAETYKEQWIRQQFGKDVDEAGLKDLVEIYKGYTKFSAAKKPELVSAATYSTTFFNEAMRKVKEAGELIELADKYYVGGEKALPESAQAAYFQLLYYPAVATANVNRLWTYKGLSDFYRTQGRASANVYAELVRKGLDYDEELMQAYNNDMPGVGDKWKGMMSSPHLGYASWNAEGAVDTRDGTENVRTTEKFPNQYQYMSVPMDASMMVATQGSEKTTRAGTVALPDFTSTGKEQYYIDVANGGGTMFEYTATADEDWIQLTTDGGAVLTQDSIGVSLDWSKITSDASGTIHIEGPNESAVDVTVKAVVVSTEGLEEKTFVDTHGYISMEAAHFANSVPGTGDAEWKEIKEYGRTLSSVKVWPTTSIFEGAQGAPYVEYKVRLNSAGNYNLLTYVAPSNNVDWDKSQMRYGIQVDDGSVTVVDSFPEGFVTNDHMQAQWPASIRDNIRTTRTPLMNLTAGVHAIRIYAVDPALVLQKLVLYPTTKALPASHLGPEESYYVGKEVESQLAMDVQDPVYSASCNMPMEEVTDVKDAIIPEDGSYRFAVEAESAANASIDVLMDGKVVATIRADGEGMFSSDVISATRGLHQFGIEVKSGTASVNSLAIDLVQDVVIGEPVYVRPSSEDGENYVTNVNDGNNWTSWKAEDDDAEPYLEFDFVDAFNIDRITISERGKTVNEYELWTYDPDRTGEEWKQVPGVGADGITSGIPIFLQGREEVRAQKVRIKFTDISAAPVISEVSLTPYVNWAREEGEAGNLTFTTKDKNGRPMDVPDSIWDGDRITKAMEITDVGTAGLPEENVNELIMEFGEERLVDTVNIISYQQIENTTATEEDPYGDGVIPNLSMKSNLVQQQYDVYYWDAEAEDWALIESIVQPQEPDRNVFNVAELSEPVMTNQIRLKIRSSYFIRIVELEALQTRHSTAVTNYAMAGSQTDGEVTLSGEAAIGAVHFETEDKDAASYTVEVAAAGEEYAAIESDNVDRTVETETGVFIIFKTPIALEKVKVVADQVGEVEAWGIVPELEE